MTQGSKGDRDERDERLETGDREIDADPAEDARIFAALRSLGDERPGAETDDATMLARVLAAANEERAPAPVIALPEASPLRSKKSPTLRRGVAMVFAGLAVVATVAYAAQRIFAPGPPPEAPPAPSATSSAPEHHDAPKPAPAPSETATKSEDVPPEPTASATAEPSPAPSASETARPPSADELLRRAQALYTAGDTAGATAAYRSLIARYPGSGEARAARITLGQLVLRGGRADEALGHFDSYLAGGGPLAIEARVGRIAALRALGRTADERAAIEDFLSRHGDGVHAARLRARLAEIAGP